MINQFDKVTCGLLGREIAEALAAVAAKHGLTVIPAGGTFSDTEYTARVRFGLAASNPFAANAERNQFEKMCEWYGLKPEHYGAKVMTPRGEVTIVGFAPKRSKFPIQGRLSDGKTLLWTTSILRGIVQSPTKS